MLFPTQKAWLANKSIEPNKRLVLSIRAALTHIIVDTVRIL